MSLNIGTMTGKSRELADTMTRRKIDIACIQETISKVVEKILLNRRSDLLITTSNQFGFKSWVLTRVYMLSKKLSKIIEA